MKSYIAILFHLVLLSCNSEPDTQTQQEKVAAIKRISNGVNRNQDLKSIELDAEEFLDQTPDGRGSLTGYFDNKSLVKIVEWIGLSYGTIEIEYYFDKENLIFAVAKESHFLVTDSGVNHNK